MKQDGFSLMEVMVSVALTGVLLKYAADFMAEAHKRDKITELRTYLSQKNKVIARIIQRDHRMVHSKVETPIQVSDCDDDGVCGSLTIHRTTTDVGANKAYGVATVTYKSVCRGLKENEEAFHLQGEPTSNSCVERFPCSVGQVNAIQVETQSIDIAHNEALTNYQISDHLQEHFAGASLCVIKDEVDDNFRIIIQAKYAKKPDNEVDPGLDNVHMAFLLSQSTEDFVVQRVKK